ncbi:hypothetical protein NJD75_05215 [Microbacterium algeriense]|nr:hypothetical protein [Microbacterium algeriense]
MGDRLSEFRCGEEILDLWLRGRARRNERTGASRTMVSVTREGRVAGHYCLSSSAVDRDDGPPPLTGGDARRTLYLLTKDARATLTR